MDRYVAILAENVLIYFIQLCVRIRNVHALMQECMRVCVRFCLFVRVPARVSVCVCVSVYLCVYVTRLHVSVC